MGHVEALYVTAEPAAPMTAVDRVEAIAGEGLEGDRKRRPDNPPAAQVSLIEAEAVEQARDQHGIDLDVAETRRSVVTRGVALNHLVGREFTVGPVRLRGVKLCEPCDHLETLTRPGVRKALVHRGGLRAEILEGGTIGVGDTVEAGAEDGQS